MKTSLTIYFCAVLISVAADSDSATDKVYTIVNENVDWNGAVAACKARGQQLVSIDCGREQYLLEKAIKKSGVSTSLWTSGTDQGNNGKFFWSGTGEPFDYTNWREGAPSPSEGAARCVSVQPQTDGAPWSDSDCKADMGYACEKPADHS